MSDLDIEIKVVAGPATAELNKVAVAAGKTEQSFEDLARAQLAEEQAMRKTAEAARIAAVASQKLAADTIQLGIAAEKTSFNIGNMVKEAAKGQAMQRLQLAAKELGASLEEATGGAFNMSDAMLGLAVAGPAGAVVAGFAGAIKDAGYNIDFATDMIKEMTKGVRDYRTVIAEGIAAQNRVNDQFAENAKLVRRAREEIEKYNAAKFAASPQGSLAKGLVGGVFGREAKKPSSGGSSFDSRGFGRDVGLGDSFASEIGNMNAAQLAREESERLGLAMALKPTEGEQSMAKSFADAGEALEGLADDFKKVAEEQKKLTEEQQLFADSVKNAATSFTDQMVDAAKGAGESWSQWGENMLDWIEKAIARAAMLQLLTGSVTGARGEGGYGGLLGALGFAHGGTYVGGVGAVYGGRWANGGSWVAPQTGGGQDTIPVLSMVSPGERIDYTPPGQAPQGGPQAPANVSLRVVNQADHDPRALAQALDGPHGDRLFVNLMRRNRGAIKPLVND